MLEEKLKELKNDIPEVSNLESKIYLDYKNKNKSKGFVFKHKRLIFAVTTAIIAVLTIASIALFNKDDVKENNSVNLLHQAKELGVTESEDGYLEFLEKLEQFSSKLSESYYDNFDDGNSNTIISPLSVYMALSLVAESTNEEAKKEILNGLGMSYEEVLNHTKYLFESNNREKIDSYGNVRYNSSLNNSIWFNNNADLNEITLKSLANNYYCDSYNADFKNHNKEANDAISDYVKEKTKGLIDQDFKLLESTYMVLMNTLYLKTIWDNEKLKFTNETYNFINSDETTTNVKLMKGLYESGIVYEEESYNHFYMSSLGNYKIKFIVPKDGYSLNDVFNKKNIANINNISDYKSNENANNTHFTRCLFPSFEAGVDEDIADILSTSFNINKIFKISDRPFSDLTDDDIACSEIRHVAKLKVDEVGIEGAAVTMSIVDTFSSVINGPVYHDFVIDRNFGYLITNEEDTILFSGVVNKI